MKNYEAPVLELLGSVERLTQAGFDKIGSTADSFTTNVNMLDGSIIADSG